MQEPGVGTNRYSYSANDPVNNLDPSGNDWFKGDQDEADERNYERAEELEEKLAEMKDSGTVRDELALVLGAKKTIRGRINQYLDRVGVPRGQRIKNDIGAFLGKALLGVRPGTARATATVSAINAMNQLPKGLPRSGTVAAGVSVNGDVVIGYSARTAAKNGLNRGNFPKDVARSFDRQCGGGATCAEAHIISQAQKQGIPTKGMAISVINVGTKTKVNGVSLPVGAPRAPCTICEVALPKYGVR